MTEVESMTYQLGIAMERSTRFFINSPSSSSCKICNTTQHNTLIRDLFFSNEKVWFKRTKGTTIGLPVWTDELVKGPSAYNTTQHNTTQDGIEVVVEPTIPALDFTILEIKKTKARS